MYIIVPFGSVASKLFSATMEEDADIAEYSAGTTYAAGATRKVTLDHTVYESLQAGNIGHTPSTSPTWWLDKGATERYKPLDELINSQSESTGEASWAISGWTSSTDTAPDSITLHNIQAESVRVVKSDLLTNVLENASYWEDASGSTPPASWTAVGSPSFYIDLFTLQITATAAGDGMYQTVGVTPGQEYQLLGLYKNTAGDIAQYEVISVGGEIVRDQDGNIVTDQDGNTVYTSAVSLTGEIELPSRTPGIDGAHGMSMFTSVFTVPDDVTSVRVYLWAKNAGDIVWFDYCYLLETEYNTTKTTKTTIATADYATYFTNTISQALDIYTTDVAFLDIPVNVPVTSYSPLYTITVNPGSTTAAYKVGEIVLGQKFEIGAMKYSPSISITDYSSKTVDTYGNVTVTERTYAKRLNCRIGLLNTILDEVARRLALYRSTAVVWVGDEDYASLIVYGFYKSFDIVLPYRDWSECSLEIEGMI